MYLYLCFVSIYWILNSSYNDKWIPIGKFTFDLSAVSHKTICFRKIDGCLNAFHFAPYDNVPYTTLSKVCQFPRNFNQKIDDVWQEHLLSKFYAKHRSENQHCVKFCTESDNVWQLSKIAMCDSSCVCEWLWEVDWDFD